jgi:hypothetical protein
MLGACDMLPPCMPFGPRLWVKEGEREKQEDQPVGKDGQAAYAQSAQGQTQEGEQEDVGNKVYPTGGPLAGLPHATQDASKLWTLPQDYYAFRDKGV